MMMDDLDVQYFYFLIEIIRYAFIINRWLKKTKSNKMSLLQYYTFLRIILLDRKKSSSQL